MNHKRFILNANDFGMSKAFNRAVLEGYESGLLRSVSLVANGNAFDDATNRVIPYCPELGIGIHLNITEGKSITSGLNLLTNETGVFNNSWLKILFKTLNDKDNLFIEQVEKEFRAQIEKIQKKSYITHIDSHNYIHAIPKIFELVCKLANEYGIEYVKTPYEKPYIVPDVFIHLNLKYFINLTKLVLLDLLTLINENKIEKYNLKTNDYIIGITYESIMNSLTIAFGLTAIKYDKQTIEATIHPCRYEDGTINNHFVEFQITKNKKLKEKIENLGYKITNYADKEILTIEQIKNEI